MNKTKFSVSTLDKKTVYIKQGYITNKLTTFARK